MNKILTTLLIIGVIISVIGLREQLKETPEQRVERIHNEANRECSRYPDEQARDCFEYWYSMIEDRN